MEFIKSWKFMAIIIGLLTVICGSLVVYGVTTHTEPGLMETTPGFSAQDTPIAVWVMAYHPDGPDGFDVQPEDVPMASPEDQAHALQAVEQAVGVINGRLGFTALDVVHDHRDLAMPMIGVEVGVPSERSPGDGVIVDAGGAAMFHAGGRECFVETVNTGTDEILGLVLQHELGHCLGLAHDPFESSIMRTTQTSTSEGFPPRITDSDRDLLRHVFGH